MTSIGRVVLRDLGDYVDVLVIHPNGDREIIGIHGNGEVCMANDPDDDHITIKPGRTPDDA